jgi:FKBP-type peptidyl-prolyl cis-trans isomerase SlyD
MSLLIGDNVVVSMHYKLTDSDGNVVDSSEGAEPLTYLHGAGNIIPGLENALVGKTQGASCQVVVQPEEGYGEVVPEMIQTIDRAAFEGVEAIEAGMAFEARGEDGAARRIVVRDVDGDQITIDGNHPLAGVELHFDVEIVSLRDATDEEKSHGHAH